MTIVKESETYTQAVKQSPTRNAFNWFVLSVYKLLNGLLCAGLFYMVCVHGLGLLRREASVMVLLFYLFLMYLIKLYRSDNIGNERISELAISQAVAVLLAYGAMFAIFNIIQYLEADFPVWFLSFCLTLALSVVWAYFGNRLYFVLYPAVKTLVIHGSGRAIDFFDKIRAYPKRFDIAARMEIAELEDGFEPLLAYNAVILNEIDSGTRNNILKYCFSNGIKAYIRPKIGDLILSNSERTYMLNLPMITVRQNEQNIGYLLIKRASDILFSILGLILASPLMLVIALCIKLSDKGPVFYRQKRLTRGAREFIIIKFRTMQVDAEKDGIARLSTEHDERVTPVGRFLRAARLDELPQLINILQGDMSFVGPRPERLEITELYAEEFPEFHLRLLVKAGLTGYAQVWGKYNAPPYDKLQMDLIYIVNQSFFTDLKILFTTVKTLFTKESTQGIQEGQVTAKNISRDKNTDRDLIH